MLILEEAARLDPKVFQETIAPLLGVAYTALLGISTPMEEECQYSQMMQLKDVDGTPLFRTMEVSLVCDACKAKGDKVTMSTCPHKQYERPPWKQDDARQNLVKALMSTDPALLLRETAGLTMSSATTAFSHDAIQAFETRKIGADVDTHFIDALYMAVDPSGGGNSETAVMTCFFTKQHVLVVRGVPPLEPLLHHPCDRDRDRDRDRYVIKSYRARVRSTSESRGSRGGTPLNSKCNPRRAAPRARPPSDTWPASTTSSLRNQGGRSRLAKKYQSLAEAS